MNGLQYLMGAIYKTRCEFASAEGFEEYLRPHFAQLPFDHQPVLKRLTSLIDEFEVPAGDIDSKKALQLVVAQDLRRLSEVLNAERMGDPETGLEDHRARYEALLRDAGLSFQSPKLFIVDKFPSPYDQMDWSATSPDLADQESYGIEAGNYFKKKYLVPYRSEILLAHEMIHAIIGQIDSRWLGRGLEEGIAVIFGELYVGARVFGPDITYLYTLYQWFDARATQLNTLYADYARMAALIYRRYGLDGLTTLIRGGRTKIKDVEQACLEGDFDLDLPEGGWDAAYSLLVDRVAMATVNNMYVSPMGSLVARHVKVGDTVEEIAVKAGISEEQVSVALEELQRKVFLVVTDDGRVDYSDVGIVSKSRSLRYYI